MSDGATYCNECGAGHAASDCPVGVVLEYKAEVVRLRAENERLAFERDQARFRVNDMHRRAQRLEGIEAHMASLRESHKRENGVAIHEARRVKALWHERYRAGVEQIRASGTSDALEGKPANYREGNLDKMIERLIAERDAARAERDAARAETSSLGEFLRDVHEQS